MLCNIYITGQVPALDRHFYLVCSLTDGRPQAFGTLITGRTAFNLERTLKLLFVPTPIHQKLIFDIWKFL